MRNKILLLWVSIVITVILLEMFFRLFHSVELKHPRLEVYQGHARVWVNHAMYDFKKNGVHRYKPGIHFRHQYDGKGIGNLEPGNCITYQINSWGYRDVEHETHKRPDTFRITVFGDSFSMGEGTRFEEIYVRRLSRAAATHKIEGKKIEIINLSMPGTDTEESFLHYQELYEKLRPDMVILQWNTNDFPVSKVSKAHGRAIGIKYRKMFRDSKKYEWSALVHYIWYTLKKREIAGQMIDISTAELKQGGMLNFGQIRKFKNMVVQHGARFLLVIFPDLVNFKNYPYQDIIDALVSFCKDEGIEAINLLPHLSEYNAQELWVHETDHHPNQLAHEITYRVIMDYFTRHIFDS